jgi:prepilin-type N-terminal cleavage/methylation domain-containing protein
MRCRGFTLIEIVIALTLTLIVIGSIHRLLVTTQRLSRTQAAQLDVQSNVRAGALVIAHELRELNALDDGSTDQTDIGSITATSITYRSARGIGFVCEPALPGQIRLARSTFSGARDPEPLRDIAYLLMEADPVAGKPDSWLRLEINAVSTTTSCPGLAGPGISISVGSSFPPPPVGTPLRIYETMELKLYQSGGEWWLGARSVSAGEAIQPVIGPLAGSDGLRLEYLDRASTHTNDPASVRSIIATLRAINNQALGASQGPPLEEELVTQVTLRNAVLHSPPE